jgi:hypothetical protein
MNVRPASRAPGVRRSIIALIVAASACVVGLALNAANVETPTTLDSTPSPTRWPTAGPAGLEDPVCPYRAGSFCAARNQQMHDILRGTLTYAPPTRMQKLETVPVTAIIDTSDLRPLEEPFPSPPAGRVPVEVTTRMQMELEGDNFDVTPKGRFEQGLRFPPTSSTTTWTWQVTPRSHGSQTLRLHTFIELSDGRTASWHEVTPPQLRDVKVQVSAISRSKDALAWLWKAVLGLASFVVAVAGAMKAARWRSRAGTESEDENEIILSDHEIDADQRDVRPAARARRD